jgi:hypothetical protein
VQIHSERTSTPALLVARIVQAIRASCLHTPEICICGPQSLCGRSDGQKSLLGVETQMLNLKADISLH